MSLPAVTDALADPHVRRHPSRVLVYWFCLGHLTPAEWRRMRVLEVHRATGLSIRRAEGALRDLVRLGYIERGPRVIDRWTYRLAMARTQSESA